MDTDSDELTETIRAQVEEWSTNSNDCFTIDVVRGDGSTAASFQPAFTYPVFGEEEAIFGYQDLAINLTFAAHNLRPHLSVSYGQKFKAIGEVRPTDIHEAIRDFLPEVAFSSQSVEDALRDEKAAEFTPPGERIHQYKRDGQTYEIWCASLADSAARQLLENMQILVPMFIEGGTILELNHDWSTHRWKLFLLYHVTPPLSPASPTFSPYSLVGYATSYRVFTFPDRQKPLQSDLDIFLSTTQSLLDFLPPLESGISNDLAPTSMPHNIATPLDLPSRERLSQFLILPPFQTSGHGAELYNTLYTHLTSPQNIRELSVEDPNEAFDDLRDTCDLLYLRAHNPLFAGLRIPTTLPGAALAASAPIPTNLIIPPETRSTLLTTMKIMPRQLDRLIEMHTLSHIPAFHRSRARITRKEKASGEMDRAYYFWRLMVKERLFVFNRDQLAQTEGVERVEKLEAALDSVVEGYGRCLERVEKREAQRGSLNGEGEVEAGAERMGKARGKRKVVEDDDDEDEGGIVEVNGNGSKKARVD